VSKEELAERLEKRFGRNEPIFIKDVMEEWSEYSRPRVFQLLRGMCGDGTLMKDIPGVYYFPEEAGWRDGTLFLDTTKIIKRRYLKENGKVIGYYSGLTLMNIAGFSNQVPNIREIVTTNESTRKRWIKVGKTRVILRRSKTKINEKNAPVMQLLEIFKRYSKRLDKPQQDNLIALTGGKVDMKILTECAKCFPKRALDNFRNSEVYNVLTR
jgi:hypothetical protein